MVIGREGGVGINIWGSVDGKTRLKTIAGQFDTVRFFCKLSACCSTRSRGHEDLGHAEPDGL